MKKNTGCGCNSHDKCPPMQSCDTAKTHDHFCTLGTLQNVNDFERTVILADVPITANVEADIRLPSFANDIKSIRKNVHLTQCKAIPVPDPAAPGFAQSLNLFIEGFVHKNIQYSEGCSGNIKDFSVNVPFKCFQPIPPGLLFHFPFFTSQKSNQITEIRELAKDGMGSDRCSFGSVTFENLNEPIECKLLRARVSQMDFPKHFDNWGRFNKITEKVTIDLVVRLTQLQRRENAGGSVGEIFFT